MVREMVIVAYQPKAGCSDQLPALLKDNVPFLRRLGLATDRCELAMKGKGGVIVEVFSRDGFRRERYEAVGGKGRTRDLRILGRGGDGLDPIPCAHCGRQESSGQQQSYRRGR
jgi:hypothetical protein